MNDDSELPAHLKATTTDRGFDHLPPILSTYPAESVRVYESSAASRPCIWLASTERGEDGRAVEVAVHLAVEDALKLAEQIQYLAANHYQL